MINGSGTIPTAKTTHSYFISDISPWVEQSVSMTQPILLGYSHPFNIGKGLSGVLGHLRGIETPDMPRRESFKLFACLDPHSESGMGLGCICLTYVDDVFFFPKAGISSYLAPGTWGLHSASPSSVYIQQRKDEKPFSQARERDFCYIPKKENTPWSSSSDSGNVNFTS